MAIDYGSKRCGLAVSDLMQSIAFPLETVAIHELYQYLELYFKREDVELIVVGEPRNLDNTDSDTTAKAREFLAKLQQRFPERQFSSYDERFTSKLAAASLIESGQKKQVRKDKNTLDMVSATILLQDYLQSKAFSR